MSQPVDGEKSMREIKFRYFDENEKKVYEIWDYTDLQKSSVRKTLMQFTGLKDKNGKEIWEGDIVKHEFGGTIYEVGWNQVWGHFTPFNFDGFKYHPNNFEVIGNIYENGDLLK